MKSEDLVDVVARAAHRCWCELMRREGWRPGAVYSQAQRTHDALVEFDRLSPRDRRTALQTVEFEETISNLGRMLRYERGPAREFLLDEMEAGLRVAWALPDQEVPPKTALRGSVVGWKAEGSELTDITVRWDDGKVTHHHPAARELMRRDGGQDGERPR